jgi:SpoVK/Ycf46/Vps4 family AAA+-type ATPase
MNNMNDQTTPELVPEHCTNKILDLSGVEIEPEIAVALWDKILQHKWLLSEQLHRDVGIRTACIDYLENTDQTPNQYEAHQRGTLLSEMGAQSIGKEMWETISDSQPPKQLVQRRIILPLIEEDLSRKHGVVPAKAILFFGPPGTGKTHFAKAIAGALSWWYIEIVPSMLMVDGVESIGANLRAIMEKASDLDEVVLFIDEFEEIAGNRDMADRIDKSITNEFLKQIPLLKNKQNKILLVCATNYIRQLDPAMLRPGRFDCIIPVGALDREGRSTILEYYLTKLNRGDIALASLAKMTSGFTPADIQYLFQQVAHFAFEKELASREDYLVTAETFAQILPKVKPSLSKKVIDEFQKDSIDYSRV